MILKKHTFSVMEHYINTAHQTFDIKLNGKSYVTILLPASLERYETHTHIAINQKKHEGHVFRYHADGKKIVSIQIDILRAVPELT